MTTQRNLRHWCVALAVVSMAVMTAQAAPQKNILFYGNSFTLGFGSTTSVNAIFNDIVIAAGHDAPIVQSAAASGQTIGWHVDNNVGAIFTLIPPAQDWDFIVMQEHSTKLTRTFPTWPNSLPESQGDVVDLYNFAEQRSPNVTPVLYETWARGPGHQFYTGANPQFPGGPSEMQAEVRAGYDALKSALDTAIGSDLTRIAPVGDAWEALNWDRLHSGDLWHAQNRGTLLAALTIYATIYEDYNTSAIDLTGVLNSVGLTATDGAQLTATVDAIPEPSTAALMGLVLLATALRRR